MRVDLERFTIDVCSLLHLAGLVGRIALLLQFIQLLHHAEVLHCVFEVGVAVERLPEVAQRLFVISLGVQSTASEHQRLGILLVVAEQRHGHVLCVPESVHVSHLQIRLTSEQLPLSWLFDT